MERLMVDSSSIHSIGYDLDTLTLEGGFGSGKIFEYDDVPEEIYLNLISAPSLGQFFNANIRNQYAYKRISR